MTQEGQPQACTLPCVASPRHARGAACRDAGADGRQPEDVGLSSVATEASRGGTRQNIDDGLMPGAVMLVARRGKVAWVRCRASASPLRPTR